MGTKAVKGSIDQLPIRIIMENRDLDSLWDLHFRDESSAINFWQQFRELILPHVPRFSKRSKKHRAYNAFFIDALKVLSVLVYNLFQHCPTLHKVVSVSDDERDLFFVPVPDTVKLTARCIQSVFRNWIADFEIKDLDLQDESFRVTYIQGGRDILRLPAKGCDKSLHLLRAILPHVEAEQTKASISAFDLITFALLLASQDNPYSFLRTLKYPSV